ncbi:hypothetical protein [Streptomyces sp. NPDC051636]|uniref:hypothetical protein n=1 Tax=Streptomyces sp. NPDC051636 TaxID=3365663 RepID=UPI00379BDA0E
MTRTPTPPGLLPLNGATLATDPRVLSAAREIGTRCGVDYTDDAAVTALLAERRRALDATQRGPLVWLGGLTLTAGALLPFLSPALPAQAAKAALLVTGPLIVIAVATLTRLRLRWKRELTHPALAGYREVLGVARAHGLPLAYVPGWLEGRTSGAGGGGKGAAPIPSYEGVRAEKKIPPYEYEGEGNEREAEAGEGTLPPIPPKPPAVTTYETIADQGGWHDETGCLLVLAAGAGVLWAATSDAPLGYGALALIPLAILIWLAGMRQGAEKQRLRAEAVAYVRAVAQAQRAGARVPELSPVLRRLLDD